MDKFLTVISLILPGIATLCNVIVVMKRYHELKQDRNEVDKVISEMDIVNTKLKEVKIRNNGKIVINEKQKEQIMKIINELDLEVNESKISS